MTKKIGLTSRTRHADFVRRTPFRDSKIIVIATEGGVTEPHYFSLFSSRDQDFFNPRVRRIDILESKNGESSPVHVIDRLRRYKSENDIGGTDQLWLVIDVDRWGKQGVLDQVVGEACREGFFLAVSSPRFEVWLLCHFIPDLRAIQDLESAIKQHVGKSKSKFQLERYAASVRFACQTAESAAHAEDPNIPSTPGTNVFKLVRQILPP